MESLARHRHGGPIARGPSLRATLIVLALAIVATGLGLAVGRGKHHSGSAPRGHAHGAPHGRAPHSPTQGIPAEAPTAPGVVRFEKDAKSSFDSEDKSANAAWIRAHFARMLTYPPFFDSRTKWYANAWAYMDSYAIFPNTATAKRHASWILRDAQGRPLYIPYGSPPTEYAADISNPAYRRSWIAAAKATVEKGYRGIFVDDVNMLAATADAQGQQAAPVSGVTHQPISDEQWREYMVTFMRELRAALPSFEIVHNSVWYEDGGTANRGTTSALVRQQIEAANVVEIERGVNDPGLTGGSGPLSVSNLLTYIDEVHAIGKGVLLAGEASGVAAMEYNLAAYFLISNGTDYVNGGGASQTVKNFWPGWSTDLGEAKGPRYLWNGLLRRDFTNGSVYLNPPGEAPVMVNGKMLAAASGRILASH